MRLRLALIMLLILELLIALNYPGWTVPPLDGDYAHALHSAIEVPTAENVARAAASKRHVEDRIRRRTTIWGCLMIGNALVVTVLILRSRRA